MAVHDRSVRPPVVFGSKLLYKLCVVRVSYSSPHARDLSSSRGAPLILLVLLLAGLTACTWVTSEGRDRGQGLRHLTAQLRLTSSVRDATLSYRDACGQSQKVMVGAPLKTALVQEMGQLFQHVYAGDATQGNGSADRVIEVRFGLKELVVFVAGKVTQTYPATVTLTANISFFDATRALLEKVQLRADVSGDVTTDGAWCDVHGIISLVQQAVDDLADDFGGYLTASTYVLQGGAVVSSGQPVIVQPGRSRGPEGSASAEPSAVPSVGPAVLSFRAILIDENKNQVLEGGERMDLEVKVSNTGGSPAHEVWVILGGSPELIEHLPNPIRVGDLQPGETKSAKVSGELNAIRGQSEAELVMSLTASSPEVEYPRGKRFRVALSPGKP